jgi:hypothetical protein
MLSMEGKGERMIIKFNIPSVELSDCVINCWLLLLVRLLCHTVS